MKIEEVKDRFIEEVGELGANLGLNRLTIQLYGLLFLEGRSLSLDEMVEELKVSKGNISLNIRTLERWGAVRKVWVKGSRKNFYQANKDVVKVVSQKIRTGLKGRLCSLKENMEKLERGTKEDAEGKAKNYRKGIKESLKIIDQADSFLTFSSN